MKWRMVSEKQRGNSLAASFLYHAWALTAGSWYIHDGKMIFK